MATAKLAGLATLMALGVCLLWLHKARASSYAAEEGVAKVERLDTAANDIIPDGAALVKLTSGYTWTEGPIWMREGYLLFADIPSNTIRKLPLGGEASIFLQPSGYLGATPFGGREPGSNGMTLDAQGRLTVAGHGQRDVYRIESLSNPAQTTILADTFEGKRLNSPNDLVYKSDGALYFTDPPYGLATQTDTDPKKELKVNGVYRLGGAAEQKPGAPPQRDKLQLLVKDLPRPNGIVFSPDEKYLYVSNSEPQKTWMRYHVNADGTLANGELFYDATSDLRPGSPDGIKVDERGNLYGSGPGGVWIFSPAGKHIATILMPEKVANLNWGGKDSKTLFITASSSVYRIELKVKGIRPH
ncbi:MAG TPA: SMP-30/gluconolactonase/LRE family protein [Candidatus Acidoferrum sp.]